jgi:vacuolar-type H+-ATPase subunit H
MGRVQSKFANDFLEQRVMSTREALEKSRYILAEFEQFVKREYQEDLDSLVEKNDILMILHCSSGLRILV